MKPKTSLIFSIIIMFGFVLVGCSSVGTENMSPERLGTIGAQVYENPERSEQILKEAKLTRKEFRNSLEEISSDPVLSERYYSSFRKSKMASN